MCKLLRSGCVACVLLLPGSALWASGSLGDAVSDLALDVRKILDNDGKNRITVGQFSGRGDVANHSSSGPLLQEALRRKLKELKVDIVDRKGDFELIGEYAVAETPDAARQFLHITLELRDRLGGARKISGLVDGKVVKYYVTNQPDLSKLLGPTAYLPPELSDAQRNEKLKEQIDRPESFLRGTRILAARNAPYAIEILTAPPSALKHKLADYQARVPKDENGLAFVPIRRDEVYGVRLINDADYDVAVDLRIDGLSMYHFSTLRDKKGQPSYQYVIVKKKSALAIRGWFVNRNDSDEFLVTEYAKSAAGQVGSSANIGTVTANFHAAWPRGGPLPPGEKSSADEHSYSSDATGKGQRFEANYVEVDYQVGALRAPISARYSKIGLND